MSFFVSWAYCVFFCNYFFSQGNIYVENHFSDRIMKICIPASLELKPLFVILDFSQMML